MQTHSRCFRTDVEWLRRIFEMDVEIATLRQCGRIASTILTELIRSVKPGISTLSIQEQFDALCGEYAVTSAMLGFQSFPATIAVSVSPTMCFGVPSKHV